MFLNVPINPENKFPNNPPTYPNKFQVSSQQFPKVLQNTFQHSKTNVPNQIAKNSTKVSISKSLVLFYWVSSVSMFGFWSLDWAFADLVIGLYAPKPSPGTPPEVWIRKIKSENGKQRFC